MIKRTVDIIGAGAGLFLLSPVLAVLAIIVRMTMGSPIFFSQQRPGLRGRPFRMLKLRTMLDAHDSEGNLLPDEARLTWLGRFLRRTSLDELPELINVLRGEMSLVGPRPLLMEYLDRYSPGQAQRHEVKPGITGWAQINGRNAINWEKKFELDVWYVNNRTFWLDSRIVWKTFWKVVRRDGISASSHATMPKFDGSKFEDSSSARKDEI